MCISYKHVHYHLVVSVKVYVQYIEYAFPSILENTLKYDLKIDLLPRLTI